MNPVEIAPGVTVTPRFVAAESVGMLARIRGTHERFELAREFLSRRPSPPYGWELSQPGSYEWRSRSDDREGARFFVIKQVLRRRVELVTREIVEKLARDMGPKG